MTLADFIEEIALLELAPAIALQIVTLASRLERDVRHACRDGPVTPAERAKQYRARKSAAKANDVAATPVTKASRKNVTARDELTLTLSKKDDSQIEKIEDSDSVNGRAERNKVSRGTRIHAGEPIGDRQIADAHRLGLSMQQTADAWTEFVDYWSAIPGQRGRKTDWDATWRNRVRQVLSRGKTHGKAKPSLTEQAFELADEARRLEDSAGIGRPLDGF